MVLYMGCCEDFKLIFISCLIGKYFFRFAQIFVLIIKKLASTSLITKELRERLLSDE